MFSGGVGEYVYGRETQDFGDMGRRLGHAMRKRLDAGAMSSGAMPWPLLPAGECIRATALGASEYSVQLSGNTSTITDPGALLQAESSGAGDALRAKGHHRSGQAVSNPPGTSSSSTSPKARPRWRWRLRWLGAPSHERIFRLCQQGVVRGMTQTIAAAGAAATSCWMATWRRRSARSCARN